MWDIIALVLLILLINVKYFANKKRKEESKGLFDDLKEVLQRQIDEGDD